MSQTIAFSSGKGGTGKSTVCAGIGNALAHCGFSAVIVELDFGFRCLDVFFGITDRIRFDISDYLRGKCRLNECINKIPAVPGLSVVCAPEGSFDAGTEYAKIAEMTARLKRLYDFVLIDTGAGADREIVRAAAEADRVFLVATPDTISVRDAANISGEFRRLGCIDQRLIINKVHKKYIKNKMIRDLDAVIDSCGIQLIGIVPEDPGLMLFYGRGKRISERSPGYAALMAIAERICGENAPLSFRKHRF